MARIYRKNQQGVYKLPFYSLFVFWWFVSLFLSLILSLTSSIFSSPIVQFGQFVSVLIVVFLIVWKVYSLILSIRKSKTISNYLTEKQAEKEITKSLLSTMSLNVQRDSLNTITAPLVRVTACASTSSFIRVDVEKLAGMYDFDKLKEDINASFKGKLSGYAVVSGLVTDDGLWYKFILEDVAIDRTWKPKTVEDIRAKPYELILQDGLTIRLDERPHLAVYGRTGSKKSTVVLGCLLQLFSMGADVRFLDGKDEFSAFKTFYQDDKIVSDTDTILGQLDDILKIVKTRQRLMAREVQKRKKIGLKASEIALQPVVLIADEVGSIVAQMDSKESKKFINSLIAIIQRGRSVGVSVIVSTQDPSVDTLPQKIRQQFATKILLGSANSDIQRMALGEVATDGNVEDFRGYYISDGLTIQPMKFFVCDLYSYNFNSLEAFETAYKLGLETDERQNKTLQIAS